MAGWSNPDFGAAPTGETVREMPPDGVYFITKRVTIALVPGVYQLPGPSGHPIEAWVLNRSSGLVSVPAGRVDAIEDGKPGEPVVLMPGDDATFWVIDGLMAPPPRVWWWSVSRASSPGAAQAVAEASAGIAAAVARVAAGRKK